MTTTAAVADGAQIQHGRAAYRAVLGLPGVPALSVVALLARIPAAAAGLVLTLHVVLTLGRGYAAAGLVAAALTVGMALGSPLLGRLVDRRGLRPMLTLTMCAGTLFWATAPLLSYPALVAGAFLGGLSGLPVQAVVRQSLAAMLPQRLRRPGFALDSMSVEISYVIGPALGAALAMALSTPTAMWAVGAGWLAAGSALLVLDPPTRPGTPATAPARPASGPGGPAGGVGEVGGSASRRPGWEWLDARMAGALAVTMASLVVLYGTELSVIASLQTSGQVGWIALVNGVWCMASLAGGFGYGAARRTPSLYVLVAMLGAATLPVALGGSWWSFALLLVPAGMLCAPTLAASTEVVTGLAPEHSRGLVTGVHASALTLGIAIGTPITGLLIDRVSPAGTILAVGVLGILVAAVTAATVRRAGARAAVTAAVPVPAR